MLEEERQRQTDGQRRSFLGLPVTTSAILLPIFYLLYHYRICRTSICFPILLILMGIGYLLPVEIRKPGFLAKAGILILGFFEAVGLFFLMGADPL